MEKQIILKAKKGNVFQNKNDIYSCGKTIHLGGNDNVDNWKEIKEGDIPIRPIDIEEDIENIT